jgi:transposase InsO family protein
LLYSSHVWPFPSAKGPGPIEFPVSHHYATAPHQLWQIDFVYLKVFGWGWFYSLTVLNDFLRYIMAWKFCMGMVASVLQNTLKRMLDASGLNKVSVIHRPRVRSNNGSTRISDRPAAYLAGKGAKHTLGATCHPEPERKSHGVSNQTARIRRAESDPTRTLAKNGSSFKTIKIEYQGIPYRKSRSWKANE